MGEGGKCKENAVHLFLFVLFMVVYSIWWCAVNSTREKGIEKDHRRRVLYILTSAWMLGTTNAVKIFIFILFCVKKLKHAKKEKNLLQIFPKEGLLKFAPKRRFFPPKNIYSPVFNGKKVFYIWVACLTHQNWLD